MPLSEIVLFGVLGALTFGLKLAMAFLPNIEPVSLLVLLFAVVFTITMINLSISKKNVHY